MRAWILVLAVLATVQPIIKVASTSQEFNTLQSILIPTQSSSTTTSSGMTTESPTYDNNENMIQEKEIEDTNIISDSKKIIDNVKPDPTTLVQIEKSFLSLFGLNKKPKIIDRSKVVIPEAIKQLYAQIMGQELNTVNIPKPGLNTMSANTVRSFTHEESKIDNRFGDHHRFRLFFNISMSIPIEEKLTAAEVQLSRKVIDNAQNVRHKILVYDILKPGIKGKRHSKRDPILFLIDVKSVKLNSTQPVSLDVLSAVKRWRNEPKRNYGLLIEIRAENQTNHIPEHKHVRLRRSVDDSPEQWSKDQPFLFTYTDDGRHKQRNIRDAVTPNRPRRAPRKKRRELCQRRPLYVDFADVGWDDWIVAPPGYEAFYCQGDCPFPMADHLNSTNHAVVQTLINSIDPTRVPKACCVPTQLQSMSMLYLDEQHKVVLKNYQDMTVLGCGCR